MGWDFFTAQAGTVEVPLTESVTALF